MRHYFPVDGEYLIKVRLMRTANDSIIGVNRSNTLELRMDRKHLRTFTVGGEGPISAWAAVANPSLYEQTADDGLEVRLSVKAGAHLVGSAFLPTRRAGARGGLCAPDSVVAGAPRVPASGD